MLPSESDVGDVGSNNSDMASQWHKDNSVAKGKQLERTSSFYPGRGDNTHVSTRLDHPNYAFLTPEVDDDGSETEECLTEEEHAVELALRHPSKFLESMAIERPSWVGLGGTKPSHSVGESSSASFDDAERSTPQDTASDSRTQPGLGTAVPTARPLVVPTQLRNEGVTPDSGLPLRTWPVDTDLVYTTGSNKVMLTIQRPLVHAVIQEAIENLQAGLLFTNAFPDDCLLTAANRHKPGATDILERLQRDQDYMLKITPVPRARICLIRSEIKERCNTITMGVFLGFDTALDIVEYVRSQLSQYTYTFPRANIANGLVMRSRPYRNHRIITVIRDMFFTGGSTSFARQFQYLFPTYECREGVVNHEVPVPMVALVATALYATIYEWRTGEQQVTEFSANAYLDVYHGNVNTLTHIRENREGAFHLMMADIYRQANTPTGNEPSSGIPIAELDLNQLDG
ncbi:hypothetical protein BJY52DRAFT_1193093 [Lactarius psammicola]|nr:hypothetical protein BJY52DRAFT_1193093 [Lactarius psammicola]